MKRRIKEIIACLLAAIFVMQTFEPALAATGKAEPEEESCMPDVAVESTDVPVKVVKIDEHGLSVDANGIGSQESVASEGAIGTETHEIVLVLDSSGSMSGDRIRELKEACLGFASDILREDPEAKIAIVTFASDVKVYEFSGKYFTSDLVALQSAINKISSGGNTAMNAGLAKADELLYKYGTADKKFIIQMADGEPNNGQGYSGADARFNNKYESEIYNTYTAMQQTANYHVLTLGFFHSMSETSKKNAREFMKSIQNSGYIEVGSGDELTFSFSNISSFISVKPVTLNKSAMISYPGYAERLTLRFTSGYKATDKTVTWISSNPAIAKVGADGV
ncbi:MAG: VWA domain-containing protein, partial [Lachnospiraceae bacterium]|nr:VWA domain-containing protein [Lachnospiraceae bacterium]